MVIIYDSDKPAHEKVRVEGYDLTVGCFDLKVEFSNNDGTPHSEIRVSRWGDTKKRKGIHQKVHASKIKSQEGKGGGDAQKA